MPNTSTGASRILYRERVQAEWIDYNGHLNDACYVLVFSRALDAFIDRIGLDADFRQQHQVSLFTLQCMTHYFKEIAQGEAFEITGQLIDMDHNKLRLYLQMFHADSGEEHAAFEALLLHVDMTQRKACPWLKQTREVLQRIRQIDQQRPIPAQAGAAIGIRRKPAEDERTRPE